MKAIRCDDIPVAHTPTGGFGHLFPPPVLAGCTDPLAAGAPDLRGLWQAISAVRNGVPVPTDDPILTYLERIEQRSDRIIDIGGGTIADARADGIQVTRRLDERRGHTREHFQASRVISTTSSRSLDPSPE